MSESSFYHISSKGKLTRVSTPQAALNAAWKDGFVWLDYCEPRREDLAPLIDLLGLHPLSIEDCFDNDQIPKIEDFPESTFILFNAYSYVRKDLSIGEVDLFIGKKFLVTVSQRDADQHAFLDGIQGAVEMEMENVRRGSAFLLHVILDYIVDRKYLAIEALEDDLDGLEEDILDDAPHFSPGKLVRMRRALLDLRKSLFHEREILVKICRNDCKFIPAKAIFHYRDVYDHLAKFFELTETYRDIVTSLMEMYLSILNNQMAKSANATNATVRRLTFITTIFMPLTLLAGIGGMSEWTMMTGVGNWRIAYPVFLAGMAVIGLASYFLLKRLQKGTG